MGYYIKICYLQKLNNNESIGLRGSSSVEYSTQAERTEMTLKYCQSHKCHTYDTKDRKRGSKGNRKNQTRRRSSFYYGNGNFCSMNCYNDWANQFMDRAIDQVSGRLNEPLTMSEENAWVKKRRYHWNPDRDSSGSGYTFTFHWHNACTGEDRDMSEEDFNNQNLQNPN